MQKIKSPKTIESLEVDDCRWPIGDPRRPDFHFCGEQKTIGRPYCARHAAMSIHTRQQPGAASQPEAAPQAETPRRAA